MSGTAPDRSRAPHGLPPRCGEALPPTNGSATFVYGVGAVGYQNCAACGAKWRYLWRDRPAPRVNRAAADGAACSHCSAPWSSPWSLWSEWVRWAGRSVQLGVTAFDLGAEDDPVADRVEARAGPRTATSPTRCTDAEGVHGLGARDRGVDSAVPGRCQGDRVRHRRTGQTTSSPALDRGSWPAAASSDLDALISADRTFVADADLLHSAPFLYSPSFLEKLDQEALAVRAADDEVRHALGLNPVT